MDVVTSNEGGAPATRKIRRIKKAAQDTAPIETAEPEITPAAKPPKSKFHADEVVVLFFICLGVGFAITLLAVSGNEDLRRVGLIGPAAATVAYPLIGWLRGTATKPAARERFADNCYYLGFIFTQAALFLAFLPSTFLGRSLEAKDVLGFFSMALSAALVGLLSRTILVQLGSSIPEAEDALHQEVEEVARQVAGQARVIVTEFQSMANAAGDVTETMNQKLEQLTSSLSMFDDVLRKELATFEAGALGVDGAMSDAKTAVDQHQRAFGEHVREAADALKTLQTGLATRSAEAVSSLQAATSALESGSTALGAFNELTPRMDALQSQLGRIEQLASNADQATTRFSEGLTRKSDEIASQLQLSVNDASGRIIEAGTQSAGKLQDSADAIRGQKDGFQRELEATVERLSSALTQFRDEIQKLNGPEGGS